MSAIINPSHRRRFWFACLFEAALIGVAAAVGWLLRRQPGADFHLHFRDGLLGGLAALPPFSVFVWMRRSAPARLAKVQAFLEEVVHPFFNGWSLAELALISLLAGISEEWLFRGAIQGGLSQTLGQPLALAAASVVFGLCHLVNWTYAFVAAGIGAYLGVVWLLTGNLLAPIIAHAGYDFLALTCLVHGWRGPGSITIKKSPPSAPSPAAGSKTRRRDDHPQ
jgi:membrane protease YdiL (CAAX protease family)